MLCSGFDPAPSVSADVYPLELLCIIVSFYVGLYPFPQLLVSFLSAVSASKIHGLHQFPAAFAYRSPPFMYIDQLPDDTVSLYLFSCLLTVDMILVRLYIQVTDPFLFFSFSSSSGSSSTSLWILFITATFDTLWVPALTVSAALW